MNVVIGLDIGSSSIKAVLFAPKENRVLRTHRLPLTSRVATRVPGHFEEDPTAIRDTAFTVIRELAAIARDDAHVVRAIGLTGQMHGGLLTDANLDPLSNFITWQDKRGEEIAAGGETYVEELSKHFADDPTGVGIHTGFLLATLHWMKGNGGFPASTTKVLGIYDWIASLLAGRAVTDIASAAAWAMFDPIRKLWREDPLQFAGIPLEWLPEIAEPGLDLGCIESTIARDLGITGDVRILATIGDTQASYLGARCGAGEVLLNFGTGSQSMWETATPVATDGVDIRYLQHDPQRFKGGPRWLATAPTLAGGEAYRIVAEFFRSVARDFTGQELLLDETFAIMDRLSLESGTNGISFDPIFAGSKFAERDWARASITGITTSNLRPASLVRALIEGMIEEIAVPYFRREGHVRHVGLVGGGGGMRQNMALRQVAEARFGLPLRLSECAEEAALGAALLCGDS
jgi:sugar (pentulose or hexulose) kinase